MKSPGWERRYRHPDGSDVLIVGRWTGTRPNGATSNARDAALLDLVEERFVADAENLRRLAAGSVGPPQRLLDRGALRFHRRRLCDRGERSAGGLRALLSAARPVFVCRLVGGRGLRRHWRRIIQGRHR